VYIQRTLFIHITVWEWDVGLHYYERIVGLYTAKKKGQNGPGRDGHRGGIVVYTCIVYHQCRVSVRGVMRFSIHSVGDVFRY
jgi:hypothetical protein